ncbi:MAG: hypothetical protein ACTSXF_00190 [Promethearchaeota archaeon]
MGNSQELDIKYKIEKTTLIKVSKFLITLLAVYYLVFGYICNIFEQTPGEHLLFIYTAFFDRESWLSLILFIAILTFQAYKEDFLVYSVKNNIWLTPFIILISWFWYIINYNVVFEPIVMYFMSIKGYINIGLLLLFEVLCGILGAYLKSKRRESIIKKRRGYI